jgi:hypothetical protein
MAAFVPNSEVNLSPTAPCEDLPSRSATPAATSGRRAAHAQRGGMNRITARLAAQRKALTLARSGHNSTVLLLSRAASTASISSVPATAAPLNPTEELARKRHITEAELSAYQGYVLPKGPRLDVNKGTDLLRYWDVIIWMGSCVHRVPAYA